MNKRKLYSFFLVSIFIFLTDIPSNVLAQGVDWQLPADHYVSAKMDMTVTHPRPEASSWAYSKNAHPGDRWEIPIVIQGGAWPFKCEIVNNGGAAGLQIGGELNRSSKIGFTAHRVNFDASNLSSGVYLYRLQAGPTIQTQKLTILK